jgi:aspartate aminotransferase-like enzyme
MGAVSLGDILTVLSAVESGLAACGVTVETGSSLSAAQKTSKIAS